MSLTVEALETQLRNLWMLDPDDAAKALLPFIERHIAADAKLWAALRTVEALGYTYHGATMWKPPLGKVPAYIAAGQQGAEDETPPLGLIAELVKAEIEYAGDYDYTQVSYKFTPDQLADFARRHATPQPPKPAGAPLPDPHNCRACTHPDCGRYDGPLEVECRAMKDNACAREYTFDAQPAVADPLSDNPQPLPANPSLSDKGAVPLPKPWQCETRMCPNLYAHDDVVRYGDAREAAGRADAVPEGWTVDRNEDGEVRVIGPDGGMHPRADKGQQAERLLHSLATALIASAAVNQPMTTQGEAVDPWATIIALCDALDIDPQAARTAPGKPSDVILEAARRKFTGSQP